MIIISIAVVGATPSHDVIESIRSVTGASISQIANALSRGMPIYEKDLLSRPKGNTFTEIRQLLANLESRSFRLRVQENGREISPDALRNIMRSSEKSERLLRELDELGHS